MTHPEKIPTLHTTDPAAHSIKKTIAELGEAFAFNGKGCNQNNS